MALENCEIEFDPNLTHRVPMKIGFDEDERWDAMMGFCGAGDTAGEFSYDVQDQRDDFDIIMFFFTDANTAFEFKMRFG
jgi:hypothetical protein